MCDKYYETVNNPIFKQQMGKRSKRSVVSNFFDFVGESVVSIKAAIMLVYKACKEK